MAACGLDYSIRKILDTKYLRDMAPLEDRVRQVIRLKDEKIRSIKYNKKEKVAHVETNAYLSDLVDKYVEEGEVHAEELNPGPSYICKLSTPSNGKNPVESSKN